MGAYGPSGWYDVTEGIMGLINDRNVTAGAYAPDSEAKRRAKAAGFYGIMLVAAIILGAMIYSPNPRIIKLALALFLFYLAVRSRLPNVIAVLAFMLPFSATTVLGPTSSLAIFLVSLVWMVRAASGRAQATWKTPIAVPLIFFLVMHVLSFYHTPSGLVMDAAIKKVLIQVSAVLLLFLMLNFITNEKWLKRMVWASSLTCAVIIALSLIELWFPSLRLIPWFTLSGSPPEKGYFEARWIWGPFRDGELLGEYMAISAPLQAFMFSRSRSIFMKSFWALMMLGALITALGTMHRMPLVSMCLGLLYLIFLFRKRMKTYQFMGVLLIGVSAVATFEFVMAEFTPTGSVLERIEKTKFYGIVPDSRRVPWQQAWERSLEYPWIGHGPHYDITHTMGKMYNPHSTYLYYFYTIGVIGVALFIWLLAVFIRMSVRYMSPWTGVRCFSTDLLAVIHVQLVVFSVDAIKISFQRNSMYFLLVWLVFGMTAACYRVAQSRTLEARRLRKAGLL